MTTHHTHRPLAASLALFALASLTSPPARPCSIAEPDPHFRQHVSPPGGVFVLFAQDPDASTDDAALVDAEGIRTPLTVLDRVGRSISVRAPELADGTSLTVDGLALLESYNFDVNEPLRVEGALAESTTPDAPDVEIVVTEREVTGDVLLFGPMDVFSCGGGQALVTEKVLIEDVSIAIDTATLGDRDVLVLDAWITEPGATLDDDARTLFEGYTFTHNGSDAFLVDDAGRATTHLALPPDTSVDLHLRYRDPARGLTSEITTVRASRAADEPQGVQLAGCSATGSSTTMPVLVLGALALGLARRRRR